MNSVEGFPSLVIATSVDKRRLYRLTAKAKPNFVSADTAHDLRARRCCWLPSAHEILHKKPSCVVAGDGRSQRAKVAARVALKRSNQFRRN